MNSIYAAQTAFGITHLHVTQPVRTFAPPALFFFSDPRIVIIGLATGGGPETHHIEE
jgi:hypothetical protein